MWLEAIARIPGLLVNVGTAFWTQADQVERGMPRLSRARRDKAFSGRALTLLARSLGVRVPLESELTQELFTSPAAAQITSVFCVTCRLSIP
jgi:hypothetical protein